jgi:phenylacetate-CoA ligase
VGRVWGNPPQYKLPKEKLRNTLLDPQIFLDTMNLNNSTMLSFITQWKKTKPTLLHGHSHSLSIFAQFCKNHSIDDIRPKGIISSSMVLMPSERDTIECVFNNKVTDLYGCEEVGLIACEYEQHQGIHLNMENLYIECIDSEGNEVRPGEEGMIVVTSLINNAMPLIRYKIEDVGSLAENACRCGRTLPLMKGVTGRTADFLVRQDGSLVAGVSLIERTLTAVPGIRQMQIVQEDLDTIVLTIVKNNAYSDKTLNDIKKEFAEVFGNNTNLYFNFADTIVQDRSGKYRFSLSKVYNPYR